LINVSYFGDRTKKNTIIYEKPNADEVQEAAAAYAAAVSQGFYFLSLPCLVYYAEIN
jgi:hypothetical protein